MVPSSVDTQLSMHAEYASVNEGFKVYRCGTGNLENEVQVLQSTVREIEAKLKDNARKPSACLLIALSLVRWRDWQHENNDSIAAYSRLMQLAAQERDGIQNAITELQQQLDKDDAATAKLNPPKKPDRN